MGHDYERIISLPHHQSAVRPHMPRVDRAAQFAPFAALTGYDETVQEAARLTEERIELTEDEIALLDESLRRAHLNSRQVQITYFQPDAKKSGGAYVQVNGVIRSFDSFKHTAIMDDQMSIPIHEIISVE